jgi:hypothetical protein
MDGTVKCKLPSNEIFLHEKNVYAIILSFINVQCSKMNSIVSANNCHPIVGSDDAISVGFDKIISIFPHEKM